MENDEAPDGASEADAAYDERGMFVRRESERGEEKEHERERRRRYREQERGCREAGERFVGRRGRDVILRIEYGDAENSERESGQCSEDFLMFEYGVVEEAETDDHEGRGDDVCEHHSGGAAQAGFFPACDGIFQAHQADRSDGDGNCKADEQAFEQK